MRKIAAEPLRVLIADELPAARRNIRELLSNEPDTVVVGAARDIYEALQMARALEPDVLVLDVSMSALADISMLLRLRRERPGLRVLTYAAELGSCDLAMRAGAEACLPKDGPLQALVDAVRGDRVGPRELEMAVAAGDLRVAVQPLVDLRTGRATRFEALCRWPHRLRGEIPPLKFIAVAEAHGLITELTVQVARAAAVEVVALAAGHHHLIANVNVSLGALLDPAFYDSLLSVIAQAGCPPSAFGIEITESTLMTDPAAVAVALWKLRSLGMRVEIDDFGTGYSSFGRLIDLPVDALKIDRRFVDRMISDAGSAAIVRACIGLAHDLGLEAVAEGVESKETLDMLRALGCDTAQGYFLAPPMPASEMDRWVTSWQGGDGVVGTTRVARGTAWSADRIGPSDVLVVDDEPAIVETLRAGLEAEGFHVVTATNGMEALGIVERLPPSVVLLDMQMPIVDGAAFVHILRSRGLKVPIVVMTAGSNASRWARTIDADGFIEKPFDVERVIAITSRFAGKHLTN